MPKIKSIYAREILSSSGAPTLSVTVSLDSGEAGTAAVPYGASAGSREAVTLFDGDNSRFNGQGMSQAVRNVEQKIAPHLIGKNPVEQKKIDQLMIDLDGTENKRKLGGNAIIAVSLATARAGALSKKLPLYQYLREIYNFSKKEYHLPKPMIVVIEGGKHADNSTDFQEYLIIPQVSNLASENIRAGVEVYTALKKILQKKKLNTNVGNEGAFAPNNLANNEAPWKLIMAAIKAAGYFAGKEIALAADLAASEIYENEKYSLKKEKKKMSNVQMIHYFSKWLSRYPIISLEDPLAEDDWHGWVAAMMELGQKIRIIADDLTVTNPSLLQKALDYKAANGVIIKPNQIGTLTETVAAIRVAKSAGWWTIISHRGGGETNDTFIIDLAVAVNCDFVKVGISRGERVEKYNRLMEIERELELT